MLKLLLYEQKHTFLALLLKYDNAKYGKICIYMTNKNLSSCSEKLEMSLIQLKFVKKTKETLILVTISQSSQPVYSSGSSNELITASQIISIKYHSLLTMKPRVLQVRQFKGTFISIGIYDFVRAATTNGMVMKYPVKERRSETRTGNYKTRERVAETMKAPRPYSDCMCKVCS